MSEELLLFMSLLLSSFAADVALPTGISTFEVVIFRTVGICVLWSHALFFDT